MTLELPAIDNRTYQQLLDEMIARIPVHNPEWTNWNDADPGITLLQLWSFMGETLLYRSNLIPERNRMAFLRLLGYGLQPAQPATGMVSFVNKRGPLEPVVLPADLEVAAGKIPFRTENGLAALPIETRAYMKQRASISVEDQADVDEQYEALYESFTAPGTTFEYYETTAVDWSVAAREPVDLSSAVDGALWLAVLARQGDDLDSVRERIQNQVLSLGIVPAVDDDTKVLPPGISDPTATRAGLEFHLPNTATPLSEVAAERVATYVPLPSTADGDLLSAPGIVQLELPARAALAMWQLDPTEDGVGAFPPFLEGDDAERLVTWIRIRAAGSSSTSTAGAQGSVRLSWVGANAATVVQRTRVPLETLGRGTGKPDQTVQLANTPVLLETLRLTVGGQVWMRVDDLATAGSEVEMVGGSSTMLADPVERINVYSVDRQSGLVRFGDGIKGRRPPDGSAIAASYDYGGGRDGVVAAGAITKGTALPAGIKVTNPVATWGGDEAETVQRAERSIAGYVRHRDRLVTSSDFADIVERTPGIDLGRVEVLPLYHPTLGDVPSPGVVTLLLIPKYDPVHPETPEPDQFFLDAVCEYLDPRRLLTTEVHLRGPAYVDIWLSIGMEALAGRDLAIVRESVKADVKSFLSPLSGGVAGTGWPLSTDVERLEAWAVAARVDGVAKVTGVLLSDSSGNDSDRIEMSGLALPRLAGISVQQGDPLPLADLLGTTTPQAGPTLLPIPFTPQEC